MSLSCLRGKEFNNQILNISLTCYKDVNNKPWFVGSQVAKLLGYKDYDAAIRRHVKPKYKKEIGTGTKAPDVSSGVVSPVVQPKSVLISEPGLWSLAFRSKLPEAEKLREWVWDDVLPSIREHGYYALPGVLEAITAIEDDDIVVLEGTERKEFRQTSKYKSELSKDLDQSEKSKRGWETRRNNKLLKEVFQKWYIQTLKSKNQKLEIKLKNQTLQTFKLKLKLFKIFS